MKEYYSKFSTGYSWMIKEEGWVRRLQGVRETQFALGNGFLGSRSVLEELPTDAKAGTYIAGLYDKIGSQVSELVNLPNPFNFKITVGGGEKIGVTSMDTLSHRRILHLRHGTLYRHSVFQDSKKRRYDYQSLRFVSMDNLNLGVMQIMLTPLDDNVTATIQTGIDTGIYNAGTVTEGRKKHFHIKEVGQYNQAGYLAVETFDKQHKIIYRSGFYYHLDEKKTFAKDNVFELKLRKNKTVTFTKLFYIDKISKDTDFNKAKDALEKKFQKSFKTRFNALVTEHVNAWEKLWDTAEISIWGDPAIEKNFRFNIYHMLICAPKDNGLSSVGAKALTGEGYRGHIFWDAEIFVFPFYLFAFPEAAKNMLLYRYQRLDMARLTAKKNEFKGAMFPWESAGIGIDETPEWSKDLDGKVIRIHTGQLEHHITADIAYAFYYYHNVTRDEQFLCNYGYEVLFETARFWASRVHLNKNKKTYDIKNVVGPNEFHTHVNNNAFTNMMAKWNLLTAHKMFHRLKRVTPDTYQSLVKKLSLTQKEVGQWRVIASRIYVNMTKKYVIEEFDGFFRKKKIDIVARDENYLPIITAKLTPRGYSKTQLVKQADVLMLLYLLRDAFNFKTKKANYAYYIDRTMHRSSLSLPMHALIASEVGDMGRAHRFFKAALHTDISDINNNTSEGIHIASIGGTWQALINGFCGLKVNKEILSIAPVLPQSWRKVVFTINFRGYRIKLGVQNSSVNICATSSGHKRRKLRIKVFESYRDISINKTYKFKRRGKMPSLHDHYL